MKKDEEYFAEYGKERKLELTLLVDLFKIDQNVKNLLIKNYIGKTLKNYLMVKIPMRFLTILTLDYKLPSCYQVKINHYHKGFEKIKL